MGKINRYVQNQLASAAVGTPGLQSTPGVVDSGGMPNVPQTPVYSDDSAGQAFRAISQSANMVANAAENVLVQEANERALAAKEKEREIKAHNEKMIRLQKNVLVAQAVSEGKKQTAAYRLELQKEHAYDPAKAKQSFSAGAPTIRDAILDRITDEEVRLEAQQQLEGNLATEFEQFGTWEAGRTIPIAERAIEQSAADLRSRVSDSGMMADNFDSEIVSWAEDDTTREMYQTVYGDAWREAMRKDIATAAEEWLLQTANDDAMVEFFDERLKIVEDLGYLTQEEASNLHGRLEKFVAAKLREQAKRDREAEAVFRSNTIIEAVGITHDPDTPASAKLGRLEELKTQAGKAGDAATVQTVQAQINTVNATTRRENNEARAADNRKRIEKNRQTKAEVDAAKKAAKDAQTKLDVEITKITEAYGKLGGPRYKDTAWAAQQHANMVMVIQKAEKDGRITPQQAAALRARNAAAQKSITAPGNVNSKDKDKGGGAWQNIQKMIPKFKKSFALPEDDALRAAGRAAFLLDEIKTTAAAQYGDINPAQMERLEALAVNMAIRQLIEEQMA